MGALDLCAAVCADRRAAGGRGVPGWRTLGWILVAMVTARSCAMAFNRWADADLDAANPRTRTRAIPAGQLSRQFVLGFTVLMGLGFVIAAAELNRLTLYLAPLVLVVLLGYSYMKRVTRWSHLVLGLALGLAPSAAWIAVRGSLDPRIVVLTAAVMLWVGGFDVLYACQDFEHDRQAGLHSIPQALGVPAAFWVATDHASCHARAADLVRLLVQFRPRRLAGSGCCRTAAGLRALHRFATRHAAPERRILHHERRHCHGLPGIRGRRCVAAEIERR